MLTGCVGAFSMLRAASSRAGDLSLALSREAYEGDRLRTTKNALSQSEAERNALTNLLIGSDGVVSFIERIEALGVAAGLDVTVEEIALEPLPASTLQNLTLRFDASGSWQQISHLLALVESLPVPLHFSSVRIETGGGEAPIWRGAFAIAALASPTSP
jgi:hypothetical protein